MAPGRLRVTSRKFVLVASPSTVTRVRFSALPCTPWIASHREPAASGLWDTTQVLRQVVASLVKQGQWPGVDQLSA